jgi:hypothetical protein
VEVPAALLAVTGETMFSKRFSLLWHLNMGGGGMTPMSVTAIVDRSGGIVIKLFFFVADDEAK